MRKHGSFFFASLSLALIQRQPRRDVAAFVIYNYQLGLVLFLFEYCGQTFRSNSTRKCTNAWRYTRNYRSLRLNRSVGFTVSRRQQPAEFEVLGKEEGRRPSAERWRSILRRWGGLDRCITFEVLPALDDGHKRFGGEEGSRVKEKFAQCPD
ncbi:hypothetical protein B0H13DRAFT_2261115 [Mycena leptocephala]|nr:hypothetical protein B0H13DRAFT_2261115 [Mycena leptocephala]